MERTQMKEIKLKHYMLQHGTDVTLSRLHCSNQTQCEKTLQHCFLLMQKFLSFLQNRWQD